MQSIYFIRISPEERLLKFIILLFCLRTLTYSTGNSSMYGMCTSVYKTRSFFAFY